MTWFFDRGSEVTACEVRRHSSSFEIAVRRPDGIETVEVAHTASALLSQLEALPRTLLTEGWRPRLVPLRSALV